MADRPIVEFLLGDVVQLRKPHPCGGREWLVDRVGADIGLRCTTCGRHILLERADLEKRLVEFVSRGDRELTEAVAPGASHPPEIRSPRPDVPTAGDT